MDSYGFTWTIMRSDVMTVAVLEQAMRISSRIWAVILGLNALEPPTYTWRHILGFNRQLPSVKRLGVEACSTADLKAHLKTMENPSRQS